ncbi:DUF2911 domain-containing protein [Ferruginibacter sp. SUN106]|uniref:DUF2911 domain-containing protein n=1 Tax=Ferruginibacter sp. SUN106 TaxID=2978348 RepID=UPI003D360499
MSCTSINSSNPPELQKPVIEPVNPYAAVDKSPMDISYYPVNYPMQLMSGNDSAALVARVIYSRPQKNGRTIFGNESPPKYVQQYGTYWRLGANEATEIEFFKPVTINDKKIAKGRYIIYCIPYADKWIIVFNSNLFSWGLHTDTTKDIAHVEIPAEKTDRPIEYFTMVFQQSPTGANLIMTWDNVKAVLPISF